MRIDLSLALLTSVSASIRARAIEALVVETTIGRAAARSGVSERTLRRWMARDAQFRRDLATAERAAFVTAMDSVQGLTKRAIETLADLMDPSSPPDVRLGAARMVAELAVRQHGADSFAPKRLPEGQATSAGVEAREDEIKGLPGPDAEPNLANTVRVIGGRIGHPRCP